MEATAGLQMSHPRPVPNSPISALKEVTPRTRMMSKSSCREYVKCSQSALESLTPPSMSSCLSSGTQEPQPVPALVQAFSEATSLHPPAIALEMSSLDTAWHEQTCAAPLRATDVCPERMDNGGPGSGP